MDKVKIFYDHSMTLRNDRQSPSPVTFGHPPHPLGLICNKMNRIYFFPKKLHVITLYNKFHYAYQIQNINHYKV